MLEDYWYLVNAVPIEANIGRSKYSHLGFRRNSVPYGQPVACAGGLSIVTQMKGPCNRRERPIVSDSLIDAGFLSLLRVVLLLLPLFNQFEFCWAHG